MTFDNNSMKGNVVKEEIRINGKHVSDVFLCVGYPKENKEEFIEKIVEKVPFYSGIGYAGRKTKESLRKNLLWSIFGGQEAMQWKGIERIGKRKLVKQIKNAIIRCAPILGKGKIRIFV